MNENDTEKESSIILIPNTRQARSHLIHRVQAYLTKKIQVYSGNDSQGESYDDIEEFWAKEGVLQGSSGATTWYKASHDYWQDPNNAPSTVDGMLGGFSVLTERDLIASRKFMEEFLEHRPQLKSRLAGGSTHACECGAGIGRVTKNLLLPLGISNSDLVETSARLLKAAPDYLGAENASKCRYFCTGLQDFIPEQQQQYDIIWIQWVVAYLTDWDLVNFLHRMKLVLKPGGVIVIKDNTCNDLAFFADKDDSDITRSYQYLRALIAESGLCVIRCVGGGEWVQWQDDFPSDIWPVPIIALEPC